MYYTIPKIPCNFPQFDNERGSPSLAGVASTKPDEGSFLNLGPFYSNPSFKESWSSDTVLLGVNCLEKAWHVRVCFGERLRATQFGETLNDPIRDLFGGMDRPELFAEGKHQ